MEHIDFGSQVQQPTVCSSLLDFLVGRGLFGDCTVEFNSANVLF